MILFLGFAVGYSNTGSQTLQCVPFPAELKFADINITSSVPTLTVAKFRLRSISGALESTLEDKPIRCSRCHVDKTAVVNYKLLHTILF